MVTQQKIEMTQEIERHKNKKYGKHINQQKIIPRNIIIPIKYIQKSGNKSHNLEGARKLR